MQTIPISSKSTNINLNYQLNAEIPVTQQVPRSSKWAKHSLTFPMTPEKDQNLPAESQTLHSQAQSMEQPEHITIALPPTPVRKSRTSRFKKEQPKESVPEQPTSIQEESKLEAAPLPEVKKETTLQSEEAKPKKARRVLRPRKALITLSPTAIAHLQALLDQPEPQLIRIGVQNRGCSGLTYNLEYVTEPGKFDEIVEQDGVKVVIDSKALFSIVGSEMDWIDDKLSSRFIFKNPNSKGTCGCGESFMV